MNFNRLRFSCFVFFICLFFLTPLVLAQSEGPWSGISNEGGEVHFQVNSSNVENFWINVYLTGGSGGFGWLEIAIGDAMAISGDSFSFSNSNLDVIGTFSSSGACTGTYDYHNPYDGYSSGTWTAYVLTVPNITSSPLSNSFGEQKHGTTSSDVKITIKNEGGGTATGLVSLTGMNSDQFEITSGEGSFSLAYNQSKDIYVRFAPTSTGFKTATLLAKGDSPCNDVSVSLTGTGTYPILSITPKYQMVSEDTGSIAFTVSNAGSSILSWTTEVDPSDTWINITGGSSGTQNGTITVNFEANDGDARIGSITVTADGAGNSPQTIEILQAANRLFKKLKASDGELSDYFGHSVSISGDYAIVGAYGDDDNGSSSGSAYIFERTGSGWFQQAKLTASDGAANDYFGISVSISGDYAIVGAYGDDDNGNDSGSAYIFERTGSVWIQRAKLTASDGASGDYCGHSVSISGDYVIVGAYRDDDNGYNSGSAYIFKKPVDGWTDMTETAKLTASDGYGYYDPWVPVSDYFGRSVSISGDYAVVGAPGDSGSAYIFNKPISGWVDMTETAKLTASDKDTAQEIPRFGNSVSISGDYAVVGADNYPSGNYYWGAAYIFNKPVSGWVDMTETAKLTASDRSMVFEKDFGNSVSISGDYVVVGAQYDNENGSKSGSTYIFKKPMIGWTDMTETTKVKASDGVSDDYFGRSVSISGDYAIVGAYGDDDNGNSSGSVYIYYVGNFPPTISVINDEITNEKTPTNPIGITVLDSETFPEDLIITGTSSNKTLVPNENIFLEGVGVYRTITITPAPNKTGTTTITITVSDGIDTASESFLLSVTALPDSDGDGLPDSDEDINKNGIVDPGETDPNNPDSDYDGLNDGVEVEILGTNPLLGDSDHNGTLDGDEDHDGDGFTNIDEVQCSSDPGDPNRKCVKGLPWLMLLLD